MDSKMDMATLENWLWDAACSVKEIAKLFRIIEFTVRMRDKGE